MRLHGSWRSRVWIMLAGTLAAGAGEATIPPEPFTPGRSYFGSGSYSGSSYIEYIAGNSPAIFSAPHGGSLRPPATLIRDRTAAACANSVDEDGFSTSTDWFTQELARRIAIEFFTRTGRHPHVIINRLDRLKLEANRTLMGGACGDAAAGEAWRDYHDFIDVAKRAAVTRFGKGWYTDLHGHGHGVARIEVGYRLSGSDLRLSDAQLDAGAAYEDTSTIRIFSEDSPRPFSALLRGPTALGTLTASAMYPSVPSAQDRAPLSGQPYFRGGFNVKKHACGADGESIDVCGVQFEHHYAGLRDTAANRKDYAEALAGIYEVFLGQNFGLSMVSTQGETIVDNDNANNDLLRSRSSVTSNWLPAAAFGTILNNQHVTTGAGPMNDGAQFFWYVPQPGRYHVYAWWTSNSTRTAAASYRVYDREGGTRLFDGRKDQRIDGGRWNLLGTWDFNYAGFAKVLMSRSLSGPGTISADAIRAVRSDGTPPPPQPPRPQGWYSRDIGSVGVPGSASEGGGTWTVSGAGADVNGTSDAFRYSYRWLSGDGHITARVASLTGAQTLVKGGVMIRASTASNAANAFMLVRKDSLAFQHRLTSGGTTSTVAGGTGSAPRWVRLTRTGASITAAVSPDGSSWANIGTRTFAGGGTGMPANVLVGLAVSSHTTTGLATAVFDKLSVVP